MNNLFVCIFISTLIVLANSLPIHDDIFANFDTTKCPSLSKSSLFDSKLEFVSICKDVKYDEHPTKIDSINKGKFLCEGILDSYLRLCDAVSNKTYQNLPTTLEQMQNVTNILKQTEPAYICKEFQSINETGSVSKDWMAILIPYLKSEKCVTLCSDIDTKTNTLCASLFFINRHINIALKQELNGTSVKQEPKTVLPNTQPKTPQVMTPEAQRIQSAKPIIQTVSPELNQAKPSTNQINAELPKSIGTSKVFASSTQAIDASTKDVPFSDPVSPKLVPQTASEMVPHVSAEAVQKSTSLDEKLPTEIKPVLQNNEENAGPQDLDKTDKKISEPVAETEVQKPANIEANKEADIERSQEYDDADNAEDFDLDQKVGPVEEKEQEPPISTKPKNKSYPDSYREDDEDSNFFSYFMFISVMFIFGYVVYHNKQKILALILEGRRDRSSRRRPNTACYRKLNSNLEEAVTSKCSGSAPHVIY